MESPREIWLDFDDTVVAVFGTQEGAKVGYNPRYHGRRSFHKPGRHAHETVAVCPHCSRCIHVPERAGHCKWNSARGR